MDSWFEIKQIEQDTFVISEPKHWEETHCYLLCGEKRAVLIDTGLGISNIKEIVDRFDEVACYSNYYSCSLGSHWRAQIFSIYSSS